MGKLVNVSSPVPFFMLINEAALFRAGRAEALQGRGLKRTGDLFPLASSSSLSQSQESLPELSSSGTTQTFSSDSIS
jgi:hypothetical protein